MDHGNDGRRVRGCDMGKAMAVRMAAKGAAEGGRGWARAMARGARAVLATMAVSLAAIAPAQAQVKRIFDNLSFEQPAFTATNPAAGCRLYIPQQLVEGWDTDHPTFQSENSSCNAVAGLTPGTVQGRILELWRGPRDNSSGGPVSGRSGGQFAELNANSFSRVFQNICLVNGENVGWRFSHRGRTSATIRDVMSMRVGTGVGSTVVTAGTTNNGAYDTPVAAQGTASVSATATGGWRDYTGAFTYTGLSGNTNIGFEAVSTADGGTTLGNFLDDIQMTLAPFVDFPQTASSTPESSAQNLPTVRVNGTVPAGGMQVRVRVVGGTAVLGTDYQFTGGAVIEGGNTIVLTIPAGAYPYSASGQFALPVQPINNTTLDGSRTIIFEILAAPAGQYQRQSSTTCGGTVNTRWTYTIVDDDATVSVIKDMVSVTPNAANPALVTVVYSIVVGNAHATNAATYSLVDAPNMDPDLRITAASYSFNGGTSTSLTATNSNTASWALATNRTLPANTSHTYLLNVTLQIQRPGSSANDACSGAATGLYNLASATVAGVPAITSSACETTPTPIWVTLNKRLDGRAIPTDQIRVQIYSAGVVQALATTSGTAAPVTVGTGTQVFTAGNLLGFSDQVGPNGVFDFDVVMPPLNYVTDIQCSNASPVSTGTVLPAGPGVQDTARRYFWGQFQTHPGDDITCTIINTPRRADLAVTKTNNATSVVSGTQTVYQIVATNIGPQAANGAVLTDPAATGLTCVTPVVCSASNGAQCPGGAVNGSNVNVALSALQAGMAIPTMPSGGVVTLQLTCNVD